MGDYREIGTGQCRQPEHESVSDKLVIHDNSNKSETTKKRVANEPTSKPKKKRKGAKNKEFLKRVLEKNISEECLEEKRHEFECVAEKLKGAIRQKDKSWLRNLVHSKTSTASKR